MNKIKNLKGKLIATAAILLYAAVCYFAKISCIILNITGIPCLGCGMTRALLCAVQLRFADAFGYHLMFWSVPLLYLCFLFDGKLFKRNTWNILFYSIILLGFLVNWARNFMFL